MYRTINFAASLLSTPTRHMALGLLLMLITSVSSAYSQSRDKNNPTRLTSKEIAGVIGDNRGESYYYTFFAGPGELTITLTLEAGRGPYTRNFVSFQLFNEDNQMIGSRMVTALNGDTEKGVEPINFSRRRRVLLRINVSEHNLASAKYWLRLDGPVDVSGMAGTDFNLNGVKSGGGFNLDDVSSDKKNGNCLPKQGTLIVKMKDGSKKIIDLSEAETVTIVP